ncbi:MAG: SPOR domain-containing protein [Colwelliaceae bacterium]|jgi:cell division protein FtsN|nr:SPOR domain-containing protein [Colwelliaceae bacterium]
MAHQDYVSRARSPKKKSNPYQKKQADVALGIPLKMKLILLLLLVALAGFGYFLWSLKDIETTDPINSATPAKTTKNKNASQLPTPPQEKWQYMEELKTKEVEVGEYAVKEKGPYKMQCGSFKTQKQAEVMKANIAFSGLSAQISAVKGSNGTWHKVYLGPYEKKRSAEKDKHKLNSNNISTCQIWLWN